MPEPANLKVLVREWMDSCSSKQNRKPGETTRNVVAAGLVVLDRLRQKCPLSRTDVFTSGGELSGARSGLGIVLKRYGVPPNYLKEATGRQAAPYGERLLRLFKYGKILAKVEPAKRDQLLLDGISVLTTEAHAWLQRQNLRISCDRQCSPATWIRSILDQAKGKSGGKVEQHLVGAKLQQRYSDKKVQNYPGHAGDAQTKRSGDFEINSISYHVTANPNRGHIEKCKTNVTSNRIPVLVVPRDEVKTAQVLAKDAGIDERITILALEEFIANNVLEISVERGYGIFETLYAIIEEYNRRVEEVETDMSLKIELQ